MTLTPEELAKLPADVQEALALAGKPAKTAEELSKLAADASYEAGKNPAHVHQAMLAHAKAAAAHKAEAADHRDNAKKADEKGDRETASVHFDAAQKSEARARHETNQVMAHAVAAGGGPANIAPVPGFASDADYVKLRDWDQKKRDELKRGGLKGEFAGPNDSFPIAGIEDVEAAVASLGQAKGDQSHIKGEIIRIAKKYGWEAGLPAEWNAEPVKNSITLGQVDDLLADFIDSDTTAGLSAWIPVLYPGRWNDLNFTAAMIDEMVATFNPKAESCPVKIGHEGNDTQPQLSQVREVKVAPCVLTNGKTVEHCLHVRIDRTPEALASLRQYRKTSIEAWPPQHQSNPTKGHWNFKGLAFLGAAAPAVSGLPPTHLSAPKGDNMTLTPEEIKAAQEREAALTASLSTTNNELIRLKAESEAKDAQLAAIKKETKAAAIKGELAQFSAILLPAQMLLLEPVALALDSDEPTVTLSDKQVVSPRTCLIAFLQGLAKNKNGNGLTNPLNVTALSGKKPEEEAEADMSDEAFKAKKVKEFSADGKMPIAKCFAEADKAVRERAKAKAEAFKK